MPHSVQSDLEPKEDLDYEYADSDAESDAPTGPKYTPQEIADIVLEFYQFLATLHYDPADLKCPPPEGWPNMALEAWGEHNFSDRAIEVLRRLPYFTPHLTSTVHNNLEIHYKSELIDYSSFNEETFETWQDCREYQDEFCSVEGDIVDLSHIICLAEGHESFGRNLFLDTLNGEISEELIRSDILNAVDMKEYFDALRERYRTLTLISCYGRATMEADLVPEIPDGEEITEEQVIAQTEWWGTDLDIQYIRQLYRHYGWPDNFQKRDAFKAVADLMELIKPSRMAWCL